MRYHSHHVVLLVTCLLSMTCRDRSTISSAPTPRDWALINIAGQATLAIPPELRTQPVQGVDSFVLQYHSKTMDLNIDYGLYSDPLNYDKKLDLMRESTTIDGREAKIVTYEQPEPLSGRRYVAAIHFQQLGAGKNTLTIWTASKTVKDRALAEKIFRTIRFK